jgi:D-galactonate transporter
MTEDPLKDVSPLEVEQTYRRITRRLIPFLIICYICAYVDRSNIGIAKLQFTSSIGINEAMYGLGGGLFYLGYSLFEVPSNLVMARIGARLTIARVMFLWSIFSVLTAFITHPYHFYILRFLLGAAEAGFFPGVLFYLSQWAPAPRRARLTALFMSAMALAGILTNPISGGIMRTMDGFQGFAGWQWLFLIEGLPGCLLAVVAYYYLTNTPREAKWLTERQKAILIRDLETDQTAKQHVHGRFVDALKDIRFYSLAVMAMAMISGLAGLSLWVPTIIRRSGVVDVWHIGLLAALPYVCGVIAQQLIAHSSDKHQERKWHAVVPGLFGAAAWFSLPLVADNTVLSIVALTCVGIGMFGATGPFWSMPANYLRGAAAAGGIALITSFGSISGFFSPILVGWATERSGTLSFGQYYFGAFLALGALLLLLGAKPDRKPVAALPLAGDGNVRVAR